MPIPPAVDWAQRLQAIAQTGLSYDTPPYDRERYLLIRCQRQCRRRHDPRAV
jgi:hypothetical protein